MKCQRVESFQNFKEFGIKFRREMESRVALELRKDKLQELAFKNISPKNFPIKFSLLDADIASIFWS